MAEKTYFFVKKIAAYVVFGTVTDDRRVPL